MSTVLLESGCFINQGDDANLSKTANQDFSLFSQMPLAPVQTAFNVPSFQEDIANFREKLCTETKRTPAA